MYVRRASLALAATLLALALAPAPAAAQSTDASRWAVLVGMEDFSGNAGVQLRGDLEFAQRPISSVVGFSIVGSLGYSHWSDSGYDWYYGNHWDWSVNLLKVVGSARFSFGRSQVVRPYADAGVGVYYAGLSGTHAVWDPYYGYYVGNTYHDSSVSLLLRLAGGVQFNLSPRFALGVELGVHPYFGDIPNDTSTSLMASASFRM
ncbi:MAG TPA: outer membrane beta-barrel protein [Anaeromyxobacter sp.]